MFNHGLVTYNCLLRILLNLVSQSLWTSYSATFKEWPFVNLFRTGREDSRELAIRAFTIGLTVVVNPILAHKSNLFSYTAVVYISLSQHASSCNCGQRLTGQKLVLLWAKSKFYSLIEFLTLKEILCTCSVIVRTPSKAFSTSSASPSLTFYSPCPHPNYPRLQRPCHPWSPSVFSTSSLFSFHCHLEGLSTLFNQSYVS